MIIDADEQEPLFKAVCCLNLAAWDILSQPSVKRLGDRELTVPTMIAPGMAVACHIKPGCVEFKFFDTASHKECHPKQAFLLKAFADDSWIVRKISEEADRAAYNAIAKEEGRPEARPVPGVDKYKALFDMPRDPGVDYLDDIGWARNLRSYAIAKAESEKRYRIAKTNGPGDDGRR